MQELAKWMKYRWLAPNDLKQLYQSEKLQAVYVPYWTYDANTFSIIRLEADVIIMKLAKLMEKKNVFKKFTGIQSVDRFINFSMIF